MVPMLPSEVGQVDGTFKLAFAAFHMDITGGYLIDFFKPKTAYRAFERSAL